MKFSFAIVIFAATMAIAAPNRLERRRFGQESFINPILSKASALFDNGSDNGQIATFAGSAISTVLGAADPCDLLDLGDKMITFGKEKLNGDKLKQYIDIIREGMSVEKNFNPTGADPRASICLNAAKPASDELRGILPLVDPALTGAADANTKTQKILQDIISGAVDGVAQAQGKSVGQQMIDVVGFSDFQKSETLNGGGAAGGAAGDNAGGNAGGNTGGDAGGNDGGNAGNTGGNAGGNAGGKDGGDAGGKDGGKDGGNAGGDAGGKDGGDAGGKDGGNAGGKDGGKDGGNAGGNAVGNGAAVAAAGENLQKSTSALGGIPPPSVINDGSDRPFKVEGNDSFLNLQAALTRSCDVQANKCQNKFNSGDRGDLKQGDCDKQRTTCNAANA